MIFLMHPDGFLDLVFAAFKTLSHDTRKLRILKKKETHISEWISIGVRALSNLGVCEWEGGGGGGDLPDQKMLAFCGRVKVRIQTTKNIHKTKKKII